ncbi:MAG: DUF4190 domain-containing protein [Oscillospiraceae bacterium]|jgi:hypothetical protein
MEPKENKNGNLAVASMILGIISVVCFCLSFTYAAPPIGLVVGIIGVILSVYSKKNEGPSSMATAGLVLSLIGVILCFVTTITCTVCVGCTACNIGRAARWAAAY